MINIFRIYESIFLVLFLVLFIGCTMDKVSSEGVKKITLNNNPKNISESCDLSDYLDFQMIELKVNGYKSYISDNINDFIVKDSLVILFDRTNLGKVVAFDLNGNFIWEKTASSESYNLFSSIGNVEFYIDRFEVYDGGGSGKFFYYDYSGNFLGTSYSDIDFTGKKHLGNNIFAFNTHLNANYDLFNNDHSVAYSLLFVDSTGVIDVALPYPAALNHGKSKFNKLYYFTNFHNNYFYHPVFSDTVYTIVGTKVSPAYNIEFEKNKYPQDVLKIFGDKGIGYFQSENFSILYNTVDVDGLIMSRYSNPSEGYVFSVIEKASNKSICNSLFVTIKETALPTPTVYSDGQFVSLINRYDYESINKYYEYKQNKLTEKELQDAIEAMGEETDEENPLLILYKIKE